jgi:hypothetical protein
VKHWFIGICILLVGGGLVWSSIQKDKQINDRLCIRSLMKQKNLPYVLAEALCTDPEGEIAQAYIERTRTKERIVTTRMGCKWLAVDDNGEISTFDMPSGSKAECERQGGVWGEHAHVEWK